jgi:hypothetical protein
MDDLTLGQSTELNQILLQNDMRKGTIRILPKCEFQFINVLNENNGFKIPEFMKSVETHKSFTNCGERINKVFWIMDLTNGQRLLSYSNPSSIKTLSNSKLISEEVTLHNKLLVPANVTTLWRLDATYLIEQGKEVYDKAEVRKYG